MNCVNTQKAKPRATRLTREGTPAAATKKQARPTTHNVVQRAGIEPATVRLRGLCSVR
jgi:hypothetical protein